MEVVVKLIKGKIDEIETYRNYKIVFDHSLNIFEKSENIYTICKMGRVCEGPIENVRTFIDWMYEKFLG